MAVLHDSVSIIRDKQRPRTGFWAPHERVLGSIPLPLCNRAALNMGKYLSRCSNPCESMYSWSFHKSQFSSSSTLDIYFICLGLLLVALMALFI